MNFFKSRFEHHPDDYSDIFIKNTILPYEKEKCQLEKLRREMEKLMEDDCPLPMDKTKEMEILSHIVNRAEKEVKEVQNILYVAGKEKKKLQENKVFSTERSTLWNGWLEIIKKGKEILIHVQKEEENKEEENEARSHDVIPEEKQQKEKESKGNSDSFASPSTLLTLTDDFRDATPFKNQRRALKVKKMIKEGNFWGSVTKKDGEKEIVTVTSKDQVKKVVSTTRTWHDGHYRKNDRKICSETLTLSLFPSTSLVIGVLH